MKKYDYLKQSFDNVQELIRFTDTKIGAILVLWGFELGLFIDQADELRLDPCHADFVGVLVFILAIAFIATISLEAYFSLIKVLRPGFAKHYSPTTYSLFYFGHISANTKETMESHVTTSSSPTRLKEITDQLFEVSRILDRKNRYCSLVVNLAALSLVELGWFLLLKFCFLTHS